MKLILTLDLYEAKCLCEFLQPHLGTTNSGTPGKCEALINYPVLSQLYHDLLSSLTDQHIEPRMIYERIVGKCTRGTHVGKEMKVVLYRYTYKPRYTTNLTQLVIEVDGKFAGQEILEHEEAVRRFNVITKMLENQVSIPGTLKQ